jgi:hypothetical protein
MEHDRIVIDLAAVLDAIGQGARAVLIGAGSGGATLVSSLPPIRSGWPGSSSSTGPPSRSCHHGSAR